VSGVHHLDGHSQYIHLIHEATWQVTNPASLIMIPYSNGNMLEIVMKIQDTKKCQHNRSPLSTASVPAPIASILQRVMVASSTQYTSHSPTINDGKALKLLPNQI